MCLAIRAVKIEVSYSLHTDSFLLAVRRFIVRGGQVKEIRSDSGTTFSSSEKELGESINTWTKRKSTKTCCKEMSSGPSTPLSLWLALRRCLTRCIRRT